jgi:hypothetical protein
VYTCHESLAYWNARSQEASQRYDGIIVLFCLALKSDKPILLYSIRIKFQNWQADLATLTALVKEKVEYLKNHRILNIQVPLGFGKSWTIVLWLLDKD